MKRSSTVLDHDCLAGVRNRRGMFDGDYSRPTFRPATRTSLDQAGFKDVSVSQDRDKGVVTLSGHVELGA